MEQTSQSPLPAKSATIAQEVLDVLAVPYQPESVNWEAMGEAHAHFLKCLDRLAGSLTPNVIATLQRTGPQDMRDELALIAWDRRRNPNRYQELLRQFVFLSTPSPLRSRRSPNAWMPYATADYRLAWEFLLLLPRVPGSAAAYEWTATEALARIGNPASLQAGLALFRASLSQKGTFSSDKEDAQDLVLNLIHTMPGRPAIHAFARCVEMAEGVSASGRIEERIRKRFGPMNQPRDTVAPWLKALDETGSGGSALERHVRSVKSSIRAGIGDRTP